MLNMQKSRLLVAPGEGSRNVGVKHFRNLKEGFVVPDTPGGIGRAKSRQSKPVRMRESTFQK
jgi:hypothetical protein